MLKAILKTRESFGYITLAAIFMAFSIVIFFSSISYNPIDLVETNGELNFFGSFGANIANFLLQYIGLSTYLIPACTLRWAFLIILEKEFRHYKQKITSLSFSILLLSFLLGSIKKYEFAFTMPLGGYTGFVISDIIIKTPFLIPIYILSVILFLTTSVVALNIEEIPELLKGLFRAILPQFNKKDEIQQEMIKPIIVKKHTPYPKEKEEHSYDFSENLSEKTNTGLKYVLPPISLLSINSAENVKKNQKNLGFTKAVEKELFKALSDFGIEATIKGSRVGPVITMYEIEPKAGIRAARIVGLADDIARSLKARSARISLIPGDSSLAIEIPNIERETVFLRELIDSSQFKESNFSIPIALGKSIAGDDIVVDLASMPHLLIAGTTGSGKSVGVNAMILSILYKLSPLDCQFIMIDPKMLELSVYNDIPHLLTPVITEPERAVMALKWLTFEMERRYRKMSGFGVRNIFGYNEALETLKATKGGVVDDDGVVSKEGSKYATKMPFIVVIIDEMADLMITAGKMIEAYIQRLAQMARAAGIHVIMATQRPSVDVITGIIKANFPTRISYQVSSKIDSRTILGMQGAEGLLGKGDMLYMPTGAKTYRIHAPFVTDSEVNNVVSSIKRAHGNTYNRLKVDIFKEIDEDDTESSSSSSGTRDSFDNANTNSPKSENDIYEEAIEIVITENKPSISYIQRRLKIGYNKAANMIERMEKEGIVSALEPSSGKRIVLKS